MPTVVTILYPHDSESSFNLEYYLTTHMPLVQAKFGPHGMKGWRANKLESTASGDPAPFSIKCTLEFDSEQEIQNAFHAQGPVVMADIKNFFNKSPIIMIGKEVGRYNWSLQ